MVASFKSLLLRRVRPTGDTRRPGLLLFIATLVVLLGGGLSSVARAQCVENPSTPFVNCNPTAGPEGGSTVVTNSANYAVSFAPATLTTIQTTAFDTELIGKLNGGVILYDQSFNAAFGTPTVAAGVTAAITAITTAGGPGVVITGPTLASHTVTTNSVSNSVYSLDAAQPQPLVATTSTFGPATVNASLFSGNPGTNGNPANPNAGVYSACSGISTLPSTTKPTCTAVNGGTFTVLAGQQDINVNTTTTYLIDTATTTTDTTLTTEVYDINGQVVQGIGTVRGAVADQGFDATDRFDRRLLDAGPNGGADGSTPGDPIWLEGYGYWSATGAAGGFPGDRATGSGINGGIDYDFHGGFKLGAAVDYDSASIDEGAVGEHAGLSLVQAGVYGGWRKGSLFAALAATYGWGSASTSVTPTGITETAVSRYSPSTAGVSAEAGDRFVVHGVALTPSIGAAWTHINSGGFTETGSTLDLTGPSYGYDRYKGWAGLAAEDTINTGGGGSVTLRAYGRAMVMGGADVVALPVTFVGSTTPLAIDGADTGAFGGDLGASAEWRIGHTVQAFAAYDARLRQRYSSQTGSLGLKVSF